VEGGWREGGGGRGRREEGGGWRDIPEQVIPTVLERSRDCGREGENPALQVQILKFTPPSAHSALAPQGRSQSL
jgi:hypothetical protein